MFKNIKHLCFDKDGVLIDVHAYWNYTCRLRTNYLINKFNLDPIKTVFVDDNLENINASKRIGFKHVSTIKMMLNTRPGVGNKKLSGREKWEGVYVFTK